MKEKLKQVLSAHVAKTVQKNNLISAAVLVPLFRKNNQDILLFTKRNQLVEHHKGEYCFPGGMAESFDESLTHTALREAQEEVGIQPEHVEILGSLDEIVTPSGFHITPYIGSIPYPYAFQPNLSEIDTLVEIPFQTFFDPSRLTTREIVHQDQVIHIPYFEIESHVIWGATGRIVKQMVDLVSKMEQERMSA